MTFIVIEGQNRTGKTTQVEALALYLEMSGLKVKRTAEPFGDLARKVITMKEVPATQTRVIISGRKEHAILIRQWLQEYDVVLCDRWLLSTLVYQGMIGRIPLPAIRKMHKEAVGNLNPKTILLDGKLYGEAVDDMDMAEAVNFQRNRSLYLDAAQMSGAIIVNNEGNVRDVHTRVVKGLLK